MIDYEALYTALRTWGQSAWAEQLERQVPPRLDPTSHGDLAGWQAVIAGLPSLPSDDVRLDEDCVRVGDDNSVTQEQRALLTNALQRLHPWRKGPFSIHGVQINAEWRSDWKWNRLKDRIADLAGRRVLDVGCGNGYYAWRMCGAGADTVVGIDPTLRFVAQYQALRHFLGEHSTYVLPLALEDLPAGLGCFDSVFSMGVLYHRRSPFDHLQRLRECLRPGGELVLETLVIEGSEQAVLLPRGRYAQMRNVWFIPSPAALVLWLERSGFRRVRVVDVTPTSLQEQRSTPWMRFHSLQDFLDPQQPGQTVEGLPAPVRAVLIAES